MIFLSDFSFEIGLPPSMEVVALSVVGDRSVVLPADDDAVCVVEADLIQNQGWYFQRVQTDSHEAEVFS